MNSYLKSVVGGCGQLIQKNIFIRVLFLFGFVCIPFYASASTYVSGELSTSTTWTSDGNPYVLSDRLIVLPGYSLTIKEGVEVQVMRNADIFMLGSDLIIEGTKNNPVTVNPFSSSSNNFDVFAFVNYGSAQVSYLKTDNMMVGLYSLGSSVSISNSHFSNGYSGVRVGDEGNVVNIFSSVFDGNWSAINVDGSLNNTVAVHQSSFRNNAQYGEGVLNNNTASVISAENNYWDSVSGPFHALNEDGFGTAVSDGVSYIPFLGKDPLPAIECTQNCNSNIFFLPGVMGSRLFEEVGGDEKERWVSTLDSDHERLFLDSDGVSVNPIYTKDGETGMVDDAYSFNIYQSFMDSLESWKNNGTLANYAYAPYDWRLFVSDVVNKGTTTIDGRVTFDASYQQFRESYLYQKLKELKRTSRNGRITIVAHSNGGLVAKYLISQLREFNDPLYHDIDNLILVAVPQVGTPDALVAILHGTKLGPRGVVMDEEHSRELSRNAPGVYGLVPTDAYFTDSFGVGVQTPVVLFEPSSTTQSFINAYGGMISDSETMRYFLYGLDGREQPQPADLVNPSIANGYLSGYSEYVIHSLLDAEWVPSKYMRISQIAGWGDPTVSTLVYRNKHECIGTDRNGTTPTTVNECSLWKDSLTFEPKKVVDGDGVVVMPSALYLNELNPLIKRWWIDLSKYNNDHYINRYHRDILEVSDIINFIKDSISSVSGKTYQYITESQPTSSGLQYLYFILHSPLDLVVRDSNGNEVSSSTESIPNGRYTKYGDVQFISVPKDSKPTVRLTGVAFGSFDLDIREQVGNETVASTTFASIVSATSTTASISLPFGTIASAEPLYVDYQGDGVPDVMFVPKIGETVTEPSPIQPTDSVSPVVQFIKPLSGDYVRSGVLPVFATSSDNIGVASSTITLGTKVVQNNLSVDLFFEKLGTTTVTAIVSDRAGNTTSTSINVRIIASASSTISDIERAYSLGWIYKKGTKDELIKKLKMMVRFEKRVVEIEEKVGNRRVKKKVEIVEHVVDKMLSRLLLAELKMYRKGKINEQAYTLIREDVEWMINN